MKKLLYTLALLLGWSFAGSLYNSTLEGDADKSRGASFGIEAQSARKNPTSWGGSYTIYSDGYRMLPPPMSVALSLKADNSGGYSGTWSMKVADDYTNEEGKMTANVIGTLTDGVMTIKLTNIKYIRGEETCYFNSGSDSKPIISNGEIVAKITKASSSYKIRPIGKMKKFLDGRGGELSITKKR